MDFRMDFPNSGNESVNNSSLKMISTLGLLKIIRSGDFTELLEELNNDRIIFSLVDNQVIEELKVIKQQMDDPEVIHLIDKAIDTILRQMSKDRGDSL